MPYRPYYRLDGHTPVPCLLHEWSDAFERRFSNQDDPWRVAATSIYDCGWVSTVFLGLDHQLFDDKPPLLFETMAVGTGTDHDQEAYRTSNWDAALAMHDQVVATIREAVAERLGRRP